MKKCLIVLMILLLMQITYGSENNAGFRWGGDKDLAVAWYLIIKEPNKIDDFFSREYSSKGSSISDEEFKQRSIAFKQRLASVKQQVEKVKQYLEKNDQRLKAAFVLQEFVNRSSFNGIIIKICWMRDYDEQVEIERLSKEKAREAKFFEHWRVPFDGKIVQDTIKKYVKEYFEEGKCSQLSSLDCQQWFTGKYAWSAEQKERFVNANEKMKKSLVASLNLLTAQINNICTGDGKQWLTYQFAKTWSDSFFDIVSLSCYQSQVGFLRHEIGRKDEFEQDIVLFINNKLTHQSIQINDANLCAYFLEKYEEDFSGEYAQEKFGEEGYLENRKLRICEKLNVLKEDIKSFKQCLMRLNESKDVFTETHCLLHNMRNCSRKVIYNGGPKNNSKEYNLFLPSFVTNDLEREQKEFLDSLIKSNDDYLQKTDNFTEWIMKMKNIKDNKLIKFDNSLVNKWFQYPAKTREWEEIVNLNIDIKSDPATLVDRFLIHIPLLINTFIPDLLLYCGRYTGSKVLYCLAFSEFLGSLHIMFPIFGFLNYITKENIFAEDRFDMNHVPTYPCSSYGIGYYIFPWLDGTFNSHVKALKKFFGNDGVRTRIRQSGIFRGSSACNWILSFFGNYLFSLNKPLGLFIHCIRIPIYYCISAFLNYIHCDNPIDRGYPVTEESFNYYKQPYAIKHLKKPLIQ